MASIESRIDAFIAKHNLSTTEIKDPICALITDAMGDLFKHVFNQPVPDSGTTTKAKKVLKAEKIEDPASVENQEDLRNCTTGVLNQFCKDQGLKVGGNKKDIMERVWRHIQGESSDEDKSSRGKTKSEKKTAEKFPCAGCNISGTPCGSSGTEVHGEYHFCWRHASDAEKFIAAMKPKTVVSEAVAKIESKASKTSAAPPAAKKGPTRPDSASSIVPESTKGKKKKIPEPEPESESEEENQDSELESEADEE
jgi:hypothetical protein